ncbi:type 1 glutamine amidotransferase domain-containing protein [Paucilactobacillus sp. N302-9]
MKKILMVETNVSHYGKSVDPTGLWLGEATEFTDEMQNNGIEVDYVSPKGGFVPIDPRSMKYVDTDIMKVYESQDFIQRGLAKTLKPSDINTEDYAAIYYTGGHGVMWDFFNNQQLQVITMQIFNQGGYVTSVCHGIAGLLNIKKENGDYLITNKHVTGFTTNEEILAGKKQIVPFLNKEVAEAHGALFEKKRAYKSFAVQDGQLITGQNPFSVRETAQLLIQQLK